MYISFFSPFLSLFLLVLVNQLKPIWDNVYFIFF